MRVLEVLFAIVLGVAAATAVVAAVTFPSGCAAGWNDPHPITPEPGLPCGRLYFACASGGCCDLATQVCGQKGHACDENSCCYVGGGTSSWGARPPQRQLSPTEARRLDAERSP